MAAAVVEVTFGGDIGTVTDPEAWSAQFVTDISAAVGISPSRVEVTEVKAGSIVVTFRILPALDGGGAVPEPSARDAVSSLEDLLDDEDSQLQTSLSFSLAGGVESYSVVEKPGRYTDMSWSTIIGVAALLLCCCGAVAFAVIRSQSKIKQAKAAGQWEKDPAAARKRVATEVGHEALAGAKQGGMHLLAAAQAGVGQAVTAINARRSRPPPPAAGSGPAGAAPDQVEVVVASVVAQPAAAAGSVSVDPPAMPASPSGRQGLEEAVDQGAAHSSQPKISVAPPARTLTPPRRRPPPAIARPGAPPTARALPTRRAPPPVQRSA